MERLSRRSRLGAQIEIWPSFKAILNDVRLSDWDDETHQPVLDAESVELELSAIAALRGDVVISTAKLVRPILYVKPVGSNGYAPVTPKGGRIRQAIDGARAVVARYPSDPDTSELAAEAFGTPEFSDGQVMATGGTSSAAGAIVTGLGGAIEWSALNRKARLSAAGIWRGENFADAGSDKPLILFAGGSAPVSISIQAAPVSGSFDGVASFSENAFFNGQLTFNSPSLRRIRMVAHRPPPGASSGPVALSGKISGDRKRLKLDNAEITLDGNPGPTSSTWRSRGRAGNQRHAGLRATRPALVPRRLHTVHAGLGSMPARSTSPSPRNTISTSAFLKRQGDGWRFFVEQRRRDGAGQGRPHRVRYFRCHHLRRHGAGRYPL